jgi:Spy/CpxP family protein refolding chaperone
VEPPRRPGRAPPNLHQPEKQPAREKRGLENSRIGAKQLEVSPSADESRAQILELRSELEKLRSQRDQLAERQQKIAELLHSPDPDKILHDLRNMLNELQLYKLLAETEAP